MDREDKHLDGAGLGEVWAKVKAQVSVLASGLGQVTAVAQDNVVAITAHDERITDLESYFDGGKAKYALDSDKLDGKHLNELFTSLSSDTTNVVSVTVGGVTKNIAQSTLRTSLGLGTAAYKSHNIYVTGIGVSTEHGTVTFVRGDDILGSITVPFATKALKDNNGLQIDTGYLKLTGGTITGNLGVNGVTTLANTTINGTLGVTGDITSASNIQASGGIAALGITELAISGNSKMSKFYVTQQTAQGSTITLIRYVDAPTYQVVEFSGSSILRINSTLPTGMTAYYDYPRYVRVHNTTSGSRSVSINFTCVTDKKSVTLAAGQYVEIMFFEPSDGYIIAKWSEIMSYQ